MLIDSGTPTGPLLRLDIPADFHQVPLAPQLEARTAEQLALVADLDLPGAGQREAVSLYLEALSIRLGKGDVSGAAFCAVRLEGRPSTATLTVAMHATHTADGGLALMGAAEAMRRDGRWSQVQIITLGGRAAVSAVSEHAPPDEGGPPAGAGTVREMAVVLPVTGHEYVVVVTVSTPSLADWETYRTLLIDTCSSIRVQPPAR